MSNMLSNVAAKCSVFLPFFGNLPLSSRVGDRPLRVTFLICFLSIAGLLKIILWPPSSILCVP